MTEADIPGVARLILCCFMSLGDVGRVQNRAPQHAHRHRGLRLRLTSQVRVTCMLINTATLASHLSKHTSLSNLICCLPSFKHAMFFKGLSI